MIPVRLTLTNFMCYRDQVPPISFESFHVACLCGGNGHGKSALIDAITWALWGEARAKSDDELIHVGQSEMAVRFEFQLGDALYRVHRRRVRPKSARDAGQTVLELQVFSRDRFVPLTQGTVRATEQKIVDLLRMKYQTFVNSVLLLQGQADAFTMQTAGARKQILAEILGLDQYDRLEKRARERLRERENEERSLRQAIAELAVEIEQRPKYEEEARELEQVEVLLKADHAAAQASLERVKARRDVLAVQRDRLQDIDRRTAAAAREFATLQRDLEQARQRVEESERLLGHLLEIKRGYARLANGRRRLDQVAEKLARLRELEGRAGVLRQAIERGRSELVGARQMLVTRIRDLETRAAEAARLEAELARLRALAAAAEEAERERDQRRAEQTEVSNRLHLLKTTNAQLKEEMQALADKVRLLQGSGVTCPLCEAELGEAGRVRIQAKYQAEGRQRKELYRRNEAECAQLAKQEAQLQRQVQQLEEKLKREGHTIQREIGTREQSLRQAREANDQLPIQRDQFLVVEGRLKSGGYAEQEQAELRSVEEAIRAVGYDEAEQARLRRDVQELQPYEERYCRLQQALASVEDQREQLARAQAALATKEEQLARDQATRSELAAQLAELPGLEQEIRAAGVTVDSLAGKLSRVREELGAARQRIATCEQLARQKKTREGELRQAVEEKAIYDELAVAFGKKGIQAMIIESTVPELEEEANGLLGRMTDNRMSLSFETQRDTKKGDTIETLDIKIADELGTRNYELYSGGESFRINFAIRVALSKLLARRAGARLQTLIVDEGFGTQDSAGREKLVEAITSIQDGFEKILVITHIDELKDAFPTRIDVVKTAEGSMAQVV